MTETLENEIRTLRAHFWSERDPEGRAFAPLADSYLRKGDLDEAGSLLDDGLGRLPEFVPGHLVAARLHRARGDVGAFRDAVEHLLELDPDNSAGLRLRGEMAEEEGDTSTAIDCFERALALNPEYDDLESRIARLRVDGASPAGTPEPEPESVSPEVDPGVEVDDSGDLEDLESFPTFDSDDVEPETALVPDEVPVDSEPEPEKGDPFEIAWEEEQEELEASADGDDLSPTVTRTLGELYLRQGLTGRALDVFEELARRNPGDRELQDRLDEIRARLDPAAGEVPADRPSEPESPEPAPVERTIGEYLGDLRAWEPGAIPIEALDPAAVPIESLAPVSDRNDSAEDPVETAIDTPSDTSASPPDRSEGDLDDFHDWLRGLRP